jgi:signal transduction histidine kinase
MTMKSSPLSRLSGRYFVALRSHLTLGAKARAQTSQQLASDAVSINLEALGLKKMHVQALGKLPSRYGDGMADELTAQAAAFFSEVAQHFQKARLFAIAANAELKRLNATLDRIAKDMAASRRNLQVQVAARKTTEAALKATEHASGNFLRDSRLLERHLQKVSHQILSANEEERKQMSHFLQDEIAQALLGIHVRLLALKKEASAKHAGLTREISATQRLVDASVKTINRFSRHCRGGAV